MATHAGWSTVGGHVVLDLVNTVAWRSDPARRVDRLVDPAALAGWAESMGLGTPAPGASDARALARTRQLRELLGATLDRYVMGEQPEPGVLNDLRHRYERASVSAYVAPGLPLTRHIEPVDLPRLARRLELETGEFLRRTDLHLLRRCESAGCGWLFLDTSRNHSRRWCDSADCGNRERVRRHAARTASSSR